MVEEDGSDNEDGKGKGAVKEKVQDGGGEGERDGVALSELKPVVTPKERHRLDARKPGPPDADECGLPVKRRRRRNHALEELESPKDAKPPPLPESAAKEDGSETGNQPEQDGMRKFGTEQHAKAEVLNEEAATETGTEATNDDVSKPGDGSHSIPRKQSVSATSECSHQPLASTVERQSTDDEDRGWQEMPALAEHRIYDDWGKVLAKSYDEVDSDAYRYGNLGGAGKGYTRVQIDDDAQSATSLDDDTAYLFKDQYARNALDAEDEEGRDLVSQMRTTKELLTEGQRIAYVGIVRLAINKMAQDMEGLEKTKGAKKTLELASEALQMWGQKIMVRLYAHMEIDTQEQVMVEQLADHGVLASDLTPALMQNARVKNPKLDSERTSVASARPSVSSPRPSSTVEKRSGTPSLTAPGTPRPSNTMEPPTGTSSLEPPGTPQPQQSDAPPAYEEHGADDLRLQDLDELSGKNIDLDLRWTVLCDLFLLLIADSTYDSRSRTLLERVGEALSVDWQEICRFEKRVTDALEMQEQADQENWNEEEHMKAREKRARNKRLMVMGLCTVGGGLVIGLSAGMLAPVIGAGLAAGFTTIGVAGTGSFLGGTGAAALIGTTGTLIGANIGLNGSNRRTGAVKTFEYRPLYNNKRVNLIVTISGWTTGKVDDVRLPFSTVDPIMGDVYSVNWEPEMLQSTGQTIQILGTEALTQTIQQILGATFLATLMAGLSVPIVLTKLAYLIDNPWTVSLARADATGLILADSLIDRNLGVRPITLVGFSLGSRVIFSCLKELARRGALGLIQNVYLFGSPVVVKKDEWLKARTVVSGRFVNGYATNDWILAYLFRATSGGVMRIAGLATVDIPAIENVNVTDTVPGHMAYRGMMPTLLHQVGWAVESEEFTEIEDPDPENHEKRQRELLDEIEEARRELEEKPEKKGFKAFFSRKKAAQKKEWETYDERSQKVLHGDDEESQKLAAENGDVMFDVDAIRSEALKLAMEGGDIEEIKQHLQVREIESTLPALKIQSATSTARPSSDSSKAGPSGLQRSQTHDGNSKLANGAAVGAAIGGPVGANGHLAPSKLNGRHNEYDRYDTTTDDSNITMSMEESSRPSFHSPALWTDVSSSYAPSPALSRRGTPFRAGSTRDMSAPERPQLHTSHTSPTFASTQHPPVVTNNDQNPWADDEDDFGKEKEMEMSFE